MSETFEPRQLAMEQILAKRKQEKQEEKASKEKLFSEKKKGGFGVDEPEIPREEVVIEEAGGNIHKGATDEGAKLKEDYNHNIKNIKSNVAIDLNVPELNFSEQKQAAEEIKGMARRLKKQTVEGNLSDSNLQLKIKIKQKAIVDPDLRDELYKYLANLFQTRDKTLAHKPGAKEYIKKKDAMEASSKETEENYLNELLGYLNSLDKKHLFSNSLEKGINWSKVNRLLERINNPKLLEKFYNEICDYNKYPLDDNYRFRLTAGKETEKTKEDKTNNIASFDKFEKLLFEKLLSTPEGYNLVEQKMLAEEFDTDGKPKAVLPLFFGRENYGDEEEDDHFDFLKSQITNAMFKIDSKRARIFFGNYLKILPNLRMESWNNMGKWSADPDSGFTPNEEKHLFNLEKKGASREVIKAEEKSILYKMDEQEKINRALEILEEDLAVCNSFINNEKEILKKTKENPYTDLNLTKHQFKYNKEKKAKIEKLIDELKKGKDINCCLDYLNERSREKTGLKSYLDRRDAEGRENIVAPELGGKNYYEDEKYLYNNELEDEASDTRFFEQYPALASAILENFKEYGKKEDIDKILSYIKADPFSSAHVKKITECFNKIDGGYAAKQLIESLRDDSTGEFRKKIITNILHRLEFGRIGISEEGVKYLERMYDLGEYNNPDYHVSRLTADGEIGIFNEEKELIKYIHLGDLNSDEKKVKAKILDFTYDTFFVGRENETEEERQKRLKYLDELKKNYYKIAQDEIFKKTDVRLNNLSFKEQGWFLIYINELKKKENGAEEKEKLKKFVKRYGEEGIKTFLSVNADENNGDKILAIGEKLDKHVASEIFARFNEAISLIKQSNKELSEQFFKNEKTVEPIAEILKRAAKILNDYKKKTDELNYTGLDEVKRKELNKEMLKELSNIKKDAIFFASMFKTAYKGKKNVDFNEIKGLDFSIRTSSMLDKNDQDEILKIIRNNYANNPEQQRVVLDGVKKSFNNKDKTRWYILSRKDKGKGPAKMTSFIRFDEKDNGNLYAASFNVEPQLRGSALGEAMYNNAVNSEAKVHKILGRVEMAKKISLYYIEKGGFVVDGIIIDKKTKIPYFKIIRDDKANSRYKSKNEAGWPKNIEEARGGYQQLLNKKEIFSDIYELGSLEMQQAINECSKNNYVVTKMAANGKKNHVKCIFEKKTPSRVEKLAA